MSIRGLPYRLGRQADAAALCSTSDEPGPPTRSCNWRLGRQDGGRWAPAEGGAPAGGSRRLLSYGGTLVFQTHPENLAIPGGISGSVGRGKRTHRFAARRNWLATTGSGCEIQFAYRIAGEQPTLYPHSVDGPKNRVTSGRPILIYCASGRTKCETPDCFPIISISSEAR